MVDSVSHFKDARHFASWVSLTPKEFSSSSPRKLGRIPKKGDRYLPCCRPMGPERCCGRPNWPDEPESRLMFCEPGPPRSRRERITTKQIAHWPTSWPGSVMPSCETTFRSEVRNPIRKRNSSVPSLPLLPKRRNRVSVVPPPCICAETDHPLWLIGSHPHGLTLLTLPAASCVPLVAIGVPRADSMSARVK